MSSGNAINIRMDVTMMFQVKIGIRNIVIPGARMHTTVVIMLTAPRMVPRPATIKPMIHRSAPARRVNGVGQRRVGGPPEVRGPPGVMKPAAPMVAPNTNSQNEKAFSRGKATSGAPICSGSTRLAKPNTIGVA